MKIQPISIHQQIKSKLKVSTKDYSAIYKTEEDAKEILMKHDVH